MNALKILLVFICFNSYLILSAQKPIDVQLSNFIDSSPPSSIEEFLDADEKMAYFICFDLPSLRTDAGPSFHYYLKQLNLDDLTVNSFDLSYVLDGD